jgi:polysaccharide export outer membrane protein
LTVGAAASQPAEAAAANDAYILGPGDGVQLTFLSPSYSQFGGSFDLLSDGSATLPLLGSVVFEGLTLSQATSWLQTMYANYLRRPLLNLQVVRQRPLQVSLVGEVENPGLYTLTPAESSTTQSGGGSISGPPTLVTAIQKAGGLTLNANLGDIRLQRRMPGSNNTQLRETNLNLIALLRTGDKRQNPYLFDGDTIIVGKADNPPDKVIEFGVANFSPASIKVMMVGEVRSPGQIELPANTPLSKAILMAGGPNQWRGRRNGVELIRLNRNGTVSSQFFDIDYSQKVSNNLNPPLRDGDAVVVSRTLYAKANDAVGAIAAPLSNLVNLLGLITIISNTSN